MTSTEHRLAACEDEIAELRAVIAKLQATGAPAAPAPPPAVRTIRQPRSEDQVATTRIVAPGAGFTMPSDPELRALFAIVLKAESRVRSEPHRLECSDAPFERFVNAFRALGGIGRSLALDDGKSMSWWIDEARQILTMSGKSGDIDSVAFAAAVLAHGDIAYRSLERFPYDLGFGLVVHGGTPARDGWRRVLDTGLIARSAPARTIGRPTYAVPPVTIEHR